MLAVMEENWPPKMSGMSSATTPPVLSGTSTPTNSRQWKNASVAAAALSLTIIDRL